MKKNQNNEQIIDPQLILQELLQPAKTIKLEFIKEKQHFTKEQFDSLLRSVTSYYNVPIHLGLVGIFATLQRGGTSRNKKSNVKIKFAEISFESKIINSYIIKANKNFTPRQFARYFANQIFDISKAHDLEGNCFVYISRNLPEYLTNNREEKYWASDFQVENENCPLNIRNALNIRYNQKFRGNLAKEAKK